MKKERENQKRPHELEDAQDHSSSDLNLKIASWGPDQATLEAAVRSAMVHSSVQEFLKGTRHRLLSIELVDTEAKVKTSQPTTPPKRYLATVYDYTHNRTILINGRLDKMEDLEVEQFGLQPLPNGQEYDAAVKILLEEPKLGPALREKHLLPYAAMPPLIEEELPDGRVERTLAIGLLPSDKRHHHEIVGVNMIHQKVVQFKNGAPDTSAANDQLCGVPGVSGPQIPRGTAGQVNVTVTQGSTVLWKFLVVRPSASSGTNGSGIELRFVDYRGKRVLYRAHVPILNVRYDNDACGPYRDWQWSEHILQANGTDVAPGFRLCPTPAQTILDSGTDAGNFEGVAIYVQGLEVVLVSEVQAGWYRYISEWRFHVDGTIRPRFGFSGVQNSCVCNRHHHHVYWRFDFDIRTPSNNVVREYNNPPIIGTSNFHTKYYEIRRLRDAGHQRRWQVENSQTGEGYMLIPSANDGVADSFGIGDVWVLRYHGTELDDGQGFTTNPINAMEHIDTFINGESVYNQDVVLWYAAHFTHDFAAGIGHIVGPELKPINWL